MRKPICFEVVTLIFKVTGHKGQIQFPGDNLKSFRAINLKLSSDTCPGLGKMLVHFGINVRVTGSILVSLEHDNSKTSRAFNLKLVTDTCLGLGKMPIDFRVTGVNFGVTVKNGHSYSNNIWYVASA